MHRISLILFDYELRLLMHPFHHAMYEVIGCGVPHLILNVVARISGFIALCDERGKNFNT